MLPVPDASLDASDICSDISHAGISFSASVTFLRSYIETKEKALADYDDRYAWAEKMLVNIANAGFFSSDRTIRQYNEDIWHL